MVNFDLNKPGLKLETEINSPRSLQAFKNTGLEPEELNPVDEKAIAQKIRDREKGRPVPPELIQARIDAAQQNRLNKLQIVCTVSLLFLTHTHYV
mgnify:CR=1 FL=1